MLRFALFKIGDRLVQDLEEEKGQAVNRTSRQNIDEGFTLIELLVVMIIIAVLSAIAIPVFVNQRAKAQDAVTKADVTKLGKEVATYWVDRSSVPTVSIVAGRYILTPVSGATQDLGAASPNVVVLTSNVLTAERWCVALNNTTANAGSWKYSARSGLGKGDCVAGDVV